MHLSNHAPCSLCYMSRTLIWHVTGRWRVIVKLHQIITGVARQLVTGTLWMSSRLDLRSQADALRQGVPRQVVLVAAAAAPALLGRMCIVLQQLRLFFILFFFGSICYAAI